MKKLLLSTVVYLLFCKCNFAQNSLCFTPASYSIYGGYATLSMCHGDFNNDGFEDIARVGIPGGGIAIDFSNGSGFYQTDTINIPNSALQYIASADFNYDSNPDIAIADCNGNRVGIALSDGNGSFSPVSFSPTNYGPFCIVPKDINTDGKIDLIVSGVDTVGIMIGNGAGSFSVHAKYKPVVGTGIVSVADFNNDGKQDFAVAGHTVVMLYKGNGSGSFSYANTASFGFIDGTASLGGYSFCKYYMATTDVDNDGKADLIGVEPNGITVAKGNGNFSFSAASHYTANVPLYGFNPTGMACADFNNDGKEDIVAGGKTDLVFFPNTGSGIFGTAIIDSSSFHNGYYNVFCPIPADLDKDGRIDLFCSRDNTSQIKVLLNCNNVDVGIKSEGLTDRKLLIYPNPTSNVLSFSCMDAKEEEIFSLTLFDATGEPIKESEITFRNRKADLDISELAAGVYCIAIYDKNGNQRNSKLVIAK